MNKYRICDICLVSSQISQKSLKSRTGCGCREVAEPPLLLDAFAEPVTQPVADPKPPVSRST
jgi:hypothetical protein